MKTYNLNKIQVISPEQRAFYEQIDKIDQQIQEKNSEKKLIDSEDQTENIDTNILSLRLQAIDAYKKLKNSKP